MAHGCKYWLARCMDYRLWQPIHEWVTKKDMVGDCDLISLGGTLKELIGDNEEVKKYLLDQIGIAYNLHGSREGFVLDHMDCGAWGGRAAFDFDSEKDFNHHMEVLKKVKEIILAKYSDMKVNLVIAMMDGDQVIEFKKVD